MWDRLSNPAALNWLWTLPVLVFMTLYFSARQRHRLTAAFGERISPVLMASLSTYRRRWKWGLEMAVLCFFIVALARPQSGESRQKVKREGVEILLLVDVSQSMLAEDVRPSRLELAKSELARFVDMSSGDRVGLVVFAGSAVTLSPLTNDQSAVKMFLESLSPLAVSTQGTDFRKALLEAKGAFQRGGIESDAETLVGRVVIVVSDGEDNEKGAIDAARELMNLGAKIFAVSVGTERGETIPLRDQSGQVVGRLKDKSGQDVISRVHQDSLQALAKEGDGRFYQLQFGGETAKQMKNDFEQMQKAIFEAADIASFNEDYQLYLALGIILALIEILLGNRRATGRIWRGRFEVAQP